MADINSNSTPPIFQKPTNPITTIIGVILGIGLLGGLIFGLVFGITYYISIVSFHSTSLQGDPSSYDPIAYFAEAQEKAGSDARLYSLEANYVKSDGTMDLNATYKPSPSVEFIFYKSAPTPTNTPPPGIGSDKWTQKIEVKVEKPGTTRTRSRTSDGVRTTYSYINFGMTAEFEDASVYGVSDPAVPTPTCSFADLWKKAITAGANPDAVSVITYDADGYDFRVNTEKYFSLKFDKKCRSQYEKDYDPSTEEPIPLNS